MSDENRNKQTSDLRNTESGKTIARRDKKQTSDLRDTEYGKNWAVSNDESISQALSEILRAAMDDQSTPKKRGVLLYIATETQPIVVTGEDVIRIGRGDGVSMPPTIDLNAYHGQELGVSRNHAEIVYSDGKYYIKDMGSTNGSFLNGNKIPPYTQTMLSDGDQIRLGHFTALVKFNT